MAGEELEGILDRHFQHFVDIPALVAHLQGLPVVAFALADVAGHIDIRQEVHFDLGDAVALAGLAAAPLDVETEAPRFVAPRARLLGTGEQFPYRSENAGIGGGVGAGGAADGALVDINALVDQLHATDGLVGRRGQGGSAVERAGRQWEQRAVDQGGFAGARHTGHTGQQAQGNLQGHRLQVVAAGAAQYQLALGVGGRALCRDIDLALARQIGASEGFLVVQDLL